MSEIEKELQMRIDAQREHIRLLRERYESLNELLANGVVSPYTNSVNEQEISAQMMMTRSSVEVANHELARLLTNLDRMRNAGKFNAR